MLKKDRPVTHSKLEALNKCENLAKEIIKTVNDDTSNINVYVGDDEKIHFVDKACADTVLNFNKGNNGITLTNIYARNYSYGSAGVVSEQTGNFSINVSNFSIIGFGTVSGSFSMTRNDSSNTFSVATGYTYNISSATTVTISFNNSASNQSGGWQSVVKTGQINKITLS